jgi:hypothetical protein
MQLFSAFLIQAHPKEGLQARFLSEMMVTVIIYQIQDPAQKRGKNAVSVAFPVRFISNFQMLGRPGSLQRLPVGRFSILKRHFVINANDVSKVFIAKAQGSRRFESF